jgi:antitoxin component of MazEF toxin-antitoxin module
MSLATFSAEVLSSGQGGGHAVVVPKEVAADFSSKRPAVLAHVDGVEYRSRLAVYGGRSYLGLRKDLLRQIGRQAGDVVEISLEEDSTELPHSAEVAEPPDLLAALAENSAARAAYDALPPSHRREYAKWIGETNQAETRAERVGKMIRRLTGS